MSIYLAYATSGREFEVAEKLASLGFTVWCGRAITFRRKGKRRRPEAVEHPKLPNYLFLTLTPDEWHDLHRRDVKHLASTLYMLRRDDERALATFRHEVDTAHREGHRIARNNDLAEIAEYKRGQRLVDLTGTFGETVLTFRRMIERAHEMHPRIQADMEMMGRVVTVELDPLDVRAAE